MGEQALIERDYAKKPLTADELKQIFGGDSLTQFLNTRHAVYKERGFAAELPSRAELIELITAEPNLLRRPVTRVGERFVIGFDEDAIRRLCQAL